MRDDAVQAVVDDLFLHHERLQDITRESDCTVHIKGGVAHVKGMVANAADRDVIRGMLARTKGVSGVWDTLGVAGDHEPRIVDIGCGGSKQVNGAIGLDAHPHPGVDVVTDMENGLPFDTGSVDYIFAAHFLEHIHDLVGLMNEIHRVLKPEGVLHAMVPHARHVNAIADPTHVRYFDVQTFKYFCQAHPHARPWRPVCVADTGDNVLADLQPLETALPASDQSLAFFFD